MWNSRDYHPKIVITKWYVLVIGWVMILAVPALLWFVVSKVLSGDTGAAILIAVLPVLLGAGIWMAGFTTTVRFDIEYMTVSRGHIPLFLWWLRNKTISKDLARTVNVTVHPQITDMTEYWVEVKTELGNRLTIFKWDGPGEPDYLMTRIQRWTR